MPTPESEAAFKKLVDAREKLTDTTKLLNEAHLQEGSGRAERQRHAELRKQWDVLYKKFRKAAEDFAGIVDQIERPK
jgi:hypothetical protein